MNTRKLPSLEERQSKYNRARFRAFKKAGGREWNTLMRQLEKKVFWLTTATIGAGIYSILITIAFISRL